MHSDNRTNYVYCNTRMFIKWKHCVKKSILYQEVQYCTTFIYAS
jgi:hypothetical protein